MQWQPIETAPGETRLLLWMAPRSWLPDGSIILDKTPPVGGHDIGADFRWYPLRKWAQEMGITHWMPLPPPPKDEG
jgi:hypothetical protein